MKHCKACLSNPIHRSTQGWKRPISRRTFLKTGGAAILAGSLSFPFQGCGATGSSFSKVYATSTGRGIDLYADYSALKAYVEHMLGVLHRDTPFFSRGDRITIKVNIVSTADCLNLPAVETYITHPLLVQALGEVLLDLGAGPLTIAEGSALPDESGDSFTAIGYDRVAEYLEAKIVDLNTPGIYGSFAEYVLEDGLSTDSFLLHPIFKETDCLISAAKLKAHSSAGITLSLKNLIGVLPLQIYGDNGTGPRRQYLHSGDQATKLPNTIVDLARLLDIKLAFVDGIGTVADGEGPWRPNISLVEYGVMVASIDPVATDAVCCGIMGLDPTAHFPDEPFKNSSNHLRIADEMGLGFHTPDHIELVKNQRYRGQALEQEYSLNFIR